MILPVPFPDSDETVGAVQVLSVAPIPTPPPPVELMHTSKFFGAGRTEHIVTGSCFCRFGLPWLS